MRNTIAPTSDKRRTRRVGRFDAQRLLWDLSGMPRLQDCGRVGVLPGGDVVIRATGTGADRRAGFAGLATCGSVWSCPVCSERILRGRQDELASAIAEWEGRGNRVALITLTMRHHKGQALADLWDGLSYAWGKVTSGRTWGRLNQSYGTPITRTITAGRRKGQTVTENRLGWARVVETTHGASGWHVHVHAALFLPAGVTVDQVDDLGGSMFAGWSAALVRKGFRAPLEDHGVDIRLAGAAYGGSMDRLSDYFAKGTYDVDATALALELARGDLKTARGGNRTPFRILSDVSAFGLAEDVDLWLEWEKASKGRRQLTWATGFRAELLTAAESTDEELAAEELGTADDDLVRITGRDFRLVIAEGGLKGVVLNVTEDDDDGSRVRALMARLGVTWTDVRPVAGQHAA